MPSEVLETSLTRSEALTIERAAKKHLDAFSRGGFALAVDLRRLQDGGAHLLYGYPHFGEYIEAKFAGRISSGNAKQLSITGRVLLTLIDARKLTLAHAHTTLGTTGARALAGLQGKHGTPTMLAIYEKAAEIAKERKTVITDVIIAALLAPALPEPEPEPEQPAEREEMEYEESPVLSEAQAELVSLLGDIYESCAKAADLVESGRMTDVARLVEEITGGVGDLPGMLVAANGAQ